ncbi:hypothetical protein FDP41_005268 [Naegleria fowleri]|uniref:Uncharacterized protein n=1 Tax=Naegleria fowleri TaxID=5763 RepID=A0A6A5BNU4_NAEFO|nr:uncharacterized protein FDP41_005268 [Naegleria fowleri]KAF0975941.1 hypothetical protein FDP41_005268 [Naegleria fowleri]CAG4712839.1 unnamed protein product [Naegleria fowleri]
MSLFVRSSMNLMDFVQQQLPSNNHKKLLSPIDDQPLVQQPPKQKEESSCTRKSERREVIRVVENRRKLFIAHVKEKKHALDQIEKNVSATLSSKEWTSFHSKQGLYSCCYACQDVKCDFASPPVITPRRFCVV